MARLLHTGLSREGWAVDVAQDAAEARHAVQSSPYDAVVCDIGLPDGSGLDWCRWLRTEGFWTPVLLLTARTSVGDRVAGLDCGADDYLGKPFAFAELAARLRALLRRGDAPRPAVLKVAGLRLDPARHEVRFSGTPIELSGREFALLEFLMRRPGEVVSRSEILDHVWDYAYDGVSNVVEVYISYLRRKLAMAGAVSMLQTVRGVGYRLASEAGDET
jgi:two-component system, OmpR family, response regulator